MDKFDSAVLGLDAARTAGFDPIKLNMVVMRGINDDEILDFAALTLVENYQVRFLEYMPIGQVTPYEWRTKYIGADEIMSKISSLYEIENIDTPISSTSKVHKSRVR